MKKNMLTALLIVFGCTMVYADFIEIGNSQGWANYIPTFSARSNGWTNFIIRSSDLGESSIFNEIQFNVYETNSPGILENQSIYFRETNSTEASVHYPFPDLAPSNYTKVFEGSFDLSSTGWTSIQLDSPFEYTGTSNLEIFIKNKDSNSVDVHFGTFTYYANSCSYNQMYSFTYGNGELSDTLPHMKLGKASTVNVIGRVLSSNNSPLNATAVLDGPVHRTANTNANGYFSVTNIIPNYDYSLNIASTGYQSVDLAIEVGLNNFSTGNIVLVEPFNVVANVIAENVEINWNNIPLLENLSHYNLFRTSSQNLSIQDNWELIGDNINNTTFTDTLWSSLENGFYKYAIRCVFNNNLVSSPNFSEWINKIELINISIHATDTIGNSLPGTNITLNSIETNEIGEFEEYQSITNDNGISILNVKPNTYQLRLFHTGYNIYNQEIDCFDSDNFIFDLQEIAYAPINVVAENEDLFCNITWDSIDSVNNTWLSKGSNDNDSSVGTGGATAFDVAHRYDESELIDYRGMYISSMKIFPREVSADYTLKIWTGVNGDIEIFSQHIQTFVNDAWNEYTLNQLVQIPNSSSLYIGYTVSTPTGYPAGQDSGPHTDGGNLIKFYNDSQWSSLYEQNPNLDGNWNIKALLTTDIDREIAEDRCTVTLRKHLPNISFEGLKPSNYSPILYNDPIITRDFTGYKVWRLNDYEQEDEETWDLLTPSPITDLSYQDNSWNVQEPGVYLYAVKSIYSEENFSIPRFSNAVMNNVYGSIEGFVLADDGFPIDGVSISIGSESLLTDDFGYYMLTNLDIGSYTVIASAEGYDTQQQEVNVTANQTTIVNFTLSETVYEFYDDFESYSNFSLNASPWIFTDLDNSNTYTVNNVTFPNAGTPMAFIVFDPEQTTPPITGGEAHSGNKYLASFAAVSPPNNDWLISPLLEVGSFGNVSFWAKSYSTEYGLERFKVHVSTGSTNTTSFTQISAGSYEQVADQWTQFSYNLDSYEGQNIRIAIQCVSHDAFIFMVDDFKFTTSGDITNYATITGQLISNDSNDGVEGEISLNGFANFEVNTDINGNFTIENVPKNHSYSLVANATGYEPYTTEFVATTSNIDLGTISLFELLVPPTQVVAQLEESSVNISWISPRNVRSTNDNFLSTSGKDSVSISELTSFTCPTTEKNINRDLIGFNVYRFLASDINNQNLWSLLNEEVITETNYSDQDLNFMHGNYKYAVKAVYSGNRLSQATTSNVVNIINEIIIPPYNLTASVSGQDVTLNWLAPGTVLPDEITEGFEETWPPADWSINTTNTVQSWARYETVSFTTGDVTPTEGMYQAGLMWDYGHQDEWLITPEISNVTNLTFDYYGSTGSEHGDNYYVKVSTNNGSTWTSVWNASDLPAGENHYDTPISIDLSAYATDTIKLAWNFVDGDGQGLWFASYIDNIIFSSQGRTVAFDSSELKAFSKAEPTTVASNVRNIDNYRFAKDPNYVSTRTTRDLTGYRIYRDEVELATIAANLLTYTDEDLDFGNYEYYVTAIYDEDESDPTNTVEVSIVDVSTTFPPQNLTATVIEADVALNWEAPLDLSDGAWITKGAEENNDGIGTDGAAEIFVAHKYTETELATYQGMYINSVKFFPREATATYTLKVWGGSAGDAELYSQTVTDFVNESWNEYALNSSVAIPTSGPVFIGYYVNTPAGFPCGCDAGPAVTGGDMIKLGEQPAWDVLSQITAINVNWNIQALVSYEGGDRVATDFVPLVKRQASEMSTAQLVQGNLNPIITTNNRFDRAVTGYKVYRDAAEIAEVGATVLTYLDTDLDNGTYEYHVTAMYGEAESLNSNSVTVTISNYDPGHVLISDSFETYPDFVLEFGDWTLVDVDGNSTYGFTGINFPGTGGPMAYIVFNPSMTVPPLDGEANAPHTGSKYMASFAANPAPNNDWMITQEFTLGDTGSFSFWGKTVMADYGLERFNVLVSTGSTNPSDFISISDPNYVEAPVAWTQFTYSLDAYANQTIRVAIQCVSNDAFIFMVDDVEIDAPGGTDNENNEVVAISALMGNYPNPFNPETTISFSTKESGQVSLDIYNIKGQKVRTLLNDHRDAGNHKVVWNGKDDDGKNVASGVFFYRMKSGKFSSTKKMILMK